MPTHFIQMNQNEYPFGESVEHDKNNRILIKQIFYKNQINVSQFLRIAKLAKKLSQMKIFIKLETIVQEEDRICLFYEYVPIKIEKYIRTMDQQFIKQYRSQLYPIGEVLSENAIITNIQLTNMGLNDKYQAKYFLGLNFVQKKHVNVYQLKNDYLEQIKRIFTKYLPSEASSIVPKKYTKNLVKLDNRMSDTQQIQNVSSYIDPQNRLVKTRKHQSIYYERSKDQQIKKRKQSYMSSVSNLRLNNLYKRINQIQLQVCKSSSKNNFKLSIEGRQFTSKSSLNGSKTLQAHNRLKGISNKNNNNSSLMNSTNNYVPQYKHNKNSIKYPGYENDDDQYNDQFSQIQEYQRSLRSNKPNRYAIKNNPTLEMSAHEQKRPHKKHSTQFPSLSDFQQPLMTLTNALRISANGLDKKQKKVNKKIQIFKERQYSQMKSVSGNTNYMIDFMSVLQEDSNNQKSVKNNPSNQEQSFKSNKNKPLALTNIVTTRNNPQKDNYQPSKVSPKVLSHTNLNSISSSPGNLYNLQYPMHLTQPHLSHNEIQLFAKQNQAQIGKLKTKPSIDQELNIHNRVKDAIQNSKKLIMKLKQKSKKNI